MDIILKINKSSELPLNEKEVSSCLDLLLKEIGCKQHNRLSLTIGFISNKSIRLLNKKFRNINKTTNVLAFSELDFNDSLCDGFLGDIVICLSVLKKEAKMRSIKLSDHLAHIIIHGTLHLLGYDHVDNDKVKIMEEIEISVLRKLGISNPY